MKWIIGADICPIPENLALFCAGDAQALVGEDLLSILQSADFTVFNLEVPLTDTEAPIKKCGPNLIAPADAIHAIEKINPHFFTLANNHILDHGVQGMDATTSLLQKHKIAYAGVGATPQEAAKPFLYEENGMRIGVYCCAEHEFSIVTEDTPGANPFDPLNSPDHIAALKEKCDFVIVLYHGGKEHYRYPSPNLQKVCRKCVEKGADLVICQHTHCIGCEELYQGGRIVYGQGNFLFLDDDNRPNEYWDTAILLSCEFQIGKPITVDHLPIKRVGNGVRLVEGEEKDQILKAFKDRTGQIKEKGFIRKNYSEFSLKNIEFYMSRISGKEETMDFSLTRMLATRNYLECEPHTELILEALNTLSFPENK